MDDADPELGTGVRRIIGHVRRPIIRLRIPANKMKGRDNPPPVIDMPQIMSYIISSRLTALELHLTGLSGINLITGNPIYRNFCILSGIYSIVETAKANHLNPFWYFTHLLTVLSKLRRKYGSIDSTPVAELDKLLVNGPRKCPHPQTEIYFFNSRHFTSINWPSLTVT